MTKKISGASLAEFHSAHFLNDLEDIRAYIRIAREEGDAEELNGALETVFVALGAFVVADALDIDIAQIWDAHSHPSEHQDTLKQIADHLETDKLIAYKPNPHLGSDFENFLKEQGIFEQVNARTIHTINALLKRRL